MARGRIPFGVCQRCGKTKRTRPIFTAALTAATRRRPQPEWLCKTCRLKYEVTYDGRKDEPIYEGGIIPADSLYPRRAKKASKASSVRRGSGRGSVDKKRAAKGGAKTKRKGGA